MEAQAFYGDMTERLAGWLREQPEVDEASVERTNMHTLSATFDGGRIELALQHDADSPDTRVRT